MLTRRQFIVGAAASAAAAAIAPIADRLTAAPPPAPVVTTVGPIEGSVTWEGWCEAFVDQTIQRLREETPPPGGIVYWGGFENEGHPWWTIGQGASMPDMGESLTLDGRYLGWQK